MIKQFLPKSLFGRALMIIVTPLVLLQVVPPDFLRPALGHDHPPISEFDRRRYRLGARRVETWAG